VVKILFRALVLTALTGSCVGAASGSSGGITVGDFVISRAGVLHRRDSKTEYLLVPKQKYPAELRSVINVDVVSRVMVARFFESGGVGVEGFFDVCFQNRGNTIVAEFVNHSGSVERLENGEVHARAITYFYVTQLHVLMALDPGTDTPKAVPLRTELARFSGREAPKP
jgi:hypothetical protein